MLETMRRERAVVLTIAALVIAAMSALVALNGFANLRSSTAVEQAPVAPIERIDLSAEHKAELLRMTDTPEKAAQFEANLRKAFGGVAKVGTGPMPQDETGGVQTTAFTTGATIVPAFAQGVSGDHWWLTMSYADAAYGGITSAAAACSAYFSPWLCIPVAGILGSWVAGYSRASNHGVWLAVYRSGYITGGRW